MAIFTHGKQCQVCGGERVVGCHRTYPSSSRIICVLGLIMPGIMANKRGLSDKPNSRPLLFHDEMNPKTTYPLVNVYITMERSTIFNG